MKRIGFYIVFLLLCIKINAAEQHILPNEYTFKHVKIEDGLSQSTILSILQDKRGYLWFGTANGLNRYDGYSFKVYSNDPQDSTSLSDNGIYSLLEDKNGYLWIGTTNGTLNKYDRKTGKFERFSLPINFNSTQNEKDVFDFPLPFSRNIEVTITSIVEDSNGYIWFGTWGRGLFRLNVNTKTIESFNSISKSKIKSNRITKLLVESNNSIWAATLGGGVYRIQIKDDSFSLQNFTNNKENQNSLSDDKITTLMKDKEGNLWLGTFNGQINKLNLSNKLTKPSFEHYKIYINDKKRNSNFIITSLLKDKNGYLWIGTLGEGIDRYDLKNEISYNIRNNPQDENSLSKNDVISLFEDKSGNIWVGTHLGKGLFKIEKRNEKFGLLNKNLVGNSGLNDDVVWAISALDETKVWVGTFKGGLNFWDRIKGKVSYFRSKEFGGPLSGDHIRAITDDGKGNLWIGTYTGGLDKFNIRTKSAIHFKYNPKDSTSLGANQVQSILIDREGNLWVGTFGGGLNFLSKEDLEKNNFRFKRFKTNPSDPFSISDDRIYSIFESQDGTIWVGTFGGGLNKFDRKKNIFISYKNLPGDYYSISNNKVMCIFEDHHGFLWIGMYGGGLNKFDPQKEIFYRFNDRNKLKSSVVYGILQDDFNHLWMSTDFGLYKYDLDNQQFTRYDLADGVQSLEFSGGAYSQSLKGEMFFGGINGFNHFYPDSIIDNSYVPPIVISSFRVLNEQIRGEQDNVELSYNQNYISFEFAALDYTNPADNQYAFMLEGFDKEWRFVDANRRIANYTNLPPGEYVFSVIGSNNDGVWNYDGKNIRLIIYPPFWKRWWFILAVILFWASVIYYFATNKYRNLLAIEKLKSKLSADLHDNVGSGLTEISILSELVTHELSNSPHHTIQKLGAISEKSRLLIDSMSDIVWMLNPQRDSFHDLIVRLKDSYSDLLNSAGISFKTNNLDKLKHLKLPMEYKQNLFLIFKEALNNSIKHSECKKIIFEAEYNKDIISITLIDDGKGIDNEDEVQGNGIRNMINRAKLINGTLSIKSSPEGTEIIYSGKITRLNKLFSILNK